jgi:anaerobic magnesium-protoporphyrin IX monomethyl ester cyclase
MSHITLIRPPEASSRHAYSAGVVPPLGLSYVAAALVAAGHDVTVIDALGEAPLASAPSVHPKLVLRGLTIEEIVRRLPTDTDGVGLSVMFSQGWPDADALVTAIRRARPDVPIFAGGEHTTASWSYILETCDALTVCVLGEGEETAVELANWIGGRGTLTAIRGIAYRHDGRPRRNEPRARIRAIDEIPLPAWHLFPIEAYLSHGLGHGVNRGRSMPILATRGCPYRCTFCSSPEMWTTRYTMRSVAAVVDEIEDYVTRYRAANIDFYDLTAIIGRKWILEFCHELARRRVRVTYQLPTGTRSEALDAEVLDALFRTGCRNITYAPESGSPRTLKLIKKHVKPERLLGSMRTACQRGIHVKANLMIGFPDETRRDVLETLRFGLRAAWAGVDDIVLFPVSPYPGTDLYRELVAAGALDPPSNEYFASLGYADLTATVSFSKHFGSIEMNVYRVVGMSAFYLTGYLRHPTRPLRAARNLARGVSETVLEQRLSELVARRRSRPLRAGHDR